MIVSCLLRSPNSPKEMGSNPFDLEDGSEDDMGEGATEAWDFINRFKEKVLLIALVVQCIR